MTENQAKTATLDDIVFQNRNKAYGAYDLRKVYRPTLTKSMIMGGALFILAMVSPMLIKLLPGSKDELNLEEVELMKLPPPPPIDPNEPPPPPPPPVELPKVATIKFLPPEVKKDEEVPEETPPPKVEELEKAAVSDKTQEGDPDAEQTVAAPEETAPVKEEAKVVEVEKEDQIFQVVEQQPEFPGGASALLGYLGKNIKYPAAASRANVSGRVFMTFVVNTDGSIQDAQVLKGLGFGCDEEALRVVKTMPKWKPGKQSGRPVRVKYNLPVSFVLE